MDKNLKGGTATPGGEEFSPAAREKYRVLSTKYGKDFYGYAGYVLLERGKAGWRKLVESIPLETLDAAVSTWVLSGRPRKPGMMGSKGDTRP